MNIGERIKKDIKLFNQNAERIEKFKFNKQIKEIIELSKMYASDAGSYFEKKDYYTAFSCISYAHGLLDAVIKMNEEKY